MFDALTMFTIAFCCEFVDNTLGGGYGTVLAPIFILMGYPPAEVVPAILFSEAVSGIWGGSWHNYFRNVNKKAALTMTLCGVVAVVIASFLVGEVIPGLYIKGYVGVLVVSMGLFVVCKSFKEIKTRSVFSKKKVAGLGVLTSWNKGITGGGFGPVSVSGLILLGFTPAVAIGTTTIAEGFVSLAGVLAYQSMIGINWTIAGILALGSASADVPSAWLVNKMGTKLPVNHLSRLVGAFMTLLGLATIVKLLL